MRFERWQLSVFVFPVVIYLHLYVAPYTKVEESFNIQAAHDILQYGVPTSNVSLKFKALFDHMTYPGAVPRTFIGAILLSGIAKPFVSLAGLVGEHQQFAVRAVLGGLNASALVVYTYNIRYAYGNTVALCYTVLQTCQFHVLYYASRTLPNMYAFALSTFALAAMLPMPSSALGPVKRARLSLYLLTVATVIFRAELTLLLGSQTLWLLIKSPNMRTRMSLIRSTVIPAVVSAGVAGLIMTVAIDTYFWQSKHFIWPELSAFVSNVFPNTTGMGASAWGTSPWHWYITSALPRLMVNPLFLLLIPYGVLFTTQRNAILDQLVPSVIYAALYSYLPHKETRFLFPVVPPITLAIAQSASYLLMRHCWIEKVVKTAFILSLIPTFLFSTLILLPLSAQGYYGAHALTTLHQHHSSLREASSLPQIYVHLTNLALQTGVTRFNEQPIVSAVQDTEMTDPPHNKPLPQVLPGSPDGRKPALTYYPSSTGLPLGSSKRHAKTITSPLWIYDKSGNETAFLTPDFWARFDYVVVEDPARVIGAWSIIAEIQGPQRPGPRLLRPHESRHVRLLPLLLDAGIQDQQDSLFPIFRAFYGRRAGQYLATAYALAHDILREGYLLPRNLSLTRGYWLTWGLETRLYVLARSRTGIHPNSDDDAAPDDPNSEPLHLLPAHLDPSSRQPQKDSLSFDELGPLIVNKDGSLSRLNNWDDMTEAEKKRTVEFLKKRNMERME